MASEYDDPFASTPTSSSRRNSLLSGMKDHVSNAVSQHLQPLAQNTFDAAKPLAENAWANASEYATNNPDKVEDFAGKAGGLLGASMGGPLTAKLGKKAGRKLGRALSKKAQETQQPQQTQSGSSNTTADWDPFA
jgi:hypothetical protein